MAIRDFITRGIGPGGSIRQFITGGIGFNPSDIQATSAPLILVEYQATIFSANSTSRDIELANIAQIETGHVYMVILVKFEFDTPAYLHSGIGNITFDGNVYTGVGQLGSIGGVDESEDLAPAPFRVSISGIDSQYLSEGLDSGNFGDVITVYRGYRKDDGTLEADPWIATRGKMEYAQVVRGDQNVVQITVQHDLALLDEIAGDRWTHEDQNAKFFGDHGLEYVHESADLKLLWGGAERVSGASDPTLPGGFPGEYYPP